MMIFLFVKLLLDLSGVQLCGKDSVLGLLQLRVLVLRLIDVRANAA